MVRAVAESKFPVIAAVGHEIDTTLIDYVADKRASTPTGAAELATVDMREIEQTFQYDIETMQKSLRDRVADTKKDIEDLKEQLYESIKDRINELSKDIKARENQLEALNPKKVLKRGYSISANKDGQVIKSIKDVKKGEKITTTLCDGTIISTIEETEEE